MKKNRTIWLATCLGLGMLVTMSSCNNDDDDPVTPTPTERSIAELVANDTTFSLLNAAVTRANIGSSLGGTNLTLFAPTNSAFRAAGFADAAAINGAPADTLRRILQYHVLSTRVTAADIPTANNTSQATAGGGTIYITKGTGGVSVNGARVTRADIAANNGVIHLIDRVLMPARGNLVATLRADSSYSYLVAAVERASTGATNIGNIIGRDSVYTIFAPTNQAFAATPYNSLTTINAANPDTLARILSYHVVRGRAFSTNLAAGSQATLGGNVTIAGSDTGGYTVAGAGNGTTPARITMTGSNMVTTNGVIHRIDRVILP